VGQLGGGRRKRLRLGGTLTEKGGVGGG
jgi:hypothetical protein